MAKFKIKVSLTQDELQALIDAHEIDQSIENDEEAELLEDNNPDLYRAYKALLSAARGL